MENNHTTKLVNTIQFGKLYVVHLDPGPPVAMIPLNITDQYELQIYLLYDPNLVVYRNATGRPAGRIRNIHYSDHWWKRFWLGNEYKPKGLKLKAKNAVPDHD